MFSFFGVPVDAAYHLVSGLTYTDRHIVDGAVEGGALAVLGTGMVVRFTQTGFVRSYALSMFGGATLLIVALLLVRG